MTTVEENIQEMKRDRVLQEKDAREFENFMETVMNVVDRLGLDNLVYQTKKLDKQIERKSAKQINYFGTQGKRKLRELVQGALADALKGIKGFDMDDLQKHVGDLVVNRVEDYLYGWLRLSFEKRDIYRMLRKDEA